MQYFKKAALAAALAGAAFGAAAADVNVYGIVSTGLFYENVRHQDKSTFGVSTDIQSSDQSRFGLKGREDLGNGWYAGFQLEAGFTPDDGALKENGTIFNRVARVYVGNETLEVSAGRMPGFTIAAEPYSAYARLHANCNLTSLPALAPADITYQPGFLSNAVAFLTNAQKGFFVQGLYSNGDQSPTVNEEVDKDWSDARHVSQVALGWVGERLRAGTVLSYEMPGTNGKAERRDATQGIHFVLNWNFGGPELSGVFYHGKNDWRIGPVPDMAKILGGANGAPAGAEVINKSEEGMTTNALFISASYPMGQHFFSGSVGALKGEWKGETSNLKHDDGEAYLAGVMYRYHLSKRAFYYAAASYSAGHDLFGSIERLNRFFCSTGVTYRF